MKTKYRVIFYFLIYVIVVYGGLALFMRSQIASDMIQRWLTHQARRQGIELNLERLSFNLVDVSMKIEKLKVADPKKGLSFHLDEFKATLRPIYLFSGVLGFDRVDLMRGELNYKSESESKKKTKVDLKTIQAILPLFAGIATGTREVRYHHLNIQDINATVDTPTVSGQCFLKKFLAERKFTGSVNATLHIVSCPLFRRNATKIELENSIDRVEGTFNVTDSMVEILSFEAETPLWQLRADGNVSPTQDVALKMSLDPRDKQRNYIFPKDIEAVNPRAEITVSGEFRDPTARIDVMGTKVSYGKTVNVDRIELLSEISRKKVKVVSGFILKNNQEIYLEDFDVDKSRFSGKVKSKNASFRDIVEALSEERGSNIHGRIDVDLVVQGELAGLKKLKSLQISGSTIVHDLNVMHPPQRFPNKKDNIIRVKKTEVRLACNYALDIFSCNDIEVTANEVPILADVVADSRGKKTEIDIDFESANLDIFKITPDIGKFVIKGSGPAKGKLFVRPGTKNKLSVEAQATSNDFWVDNHYLGKLKSVVTYNWDVDVLAFTEAEIHHKLGRAQGEFGINFSHELNWLWGKMEILSATGETLADWGGHILHDNLQFKGGRWSGNIDFKGNAVLGKFTGRANLRGSHSDWMGQQFDTQHLSAIGDERGVLLDNITLTKGKWALTGNLLLASDQTIKGQLSGYGINLEEVSLPFPRKAVFSGKGDLQAKVFGTISAPKVKSNFVAEDVTSGGENIEKMIVNFYYDSLESQRWEFLSTRDNKLIYDVGLKDFLVTYNFNEFNVFPYLRLWVPLKAAATNKLVVTSKGNVKGRLEGLKLQEMDLKIGKMSFHSRSTDLKSQPFTFSLRDNKVPVLVEFYGSKTSASLSGLLNSEGDGNLRARGKISLGWMTDWVSAIDWSNGEFDIDLAMKVRNWLPTDVEGAGNVRNAEIDFSFLKDRLTNFSGEFVFSPTALVIQQSKANIGSGSMFISGEIGYPWIKGSQVNLRNEFKKVQLRPNPDMFMGFDGQVLITGKKRPFKLEGNVVLEHAEISGERFSDEIIGSEIESRFLPEEFQQGQRELFLLDIAVSIANQFRVESPLFKGEFKGDVRIVGTDAKPIVLGNVVINNGEIDFRGSTFIIESGTLGFENQTRNDPILNVSSYANFEQVTGDEDSRREELYKVFLNILGKWSRPRLEYSSDPPLSEEDITSLIVFGVTSQEFGKREGEDVLQQELVPQLFARSRVSRDLEKSTGFRVRLTSDYSDTTKEGNLPRVAVSRRLGRKVEVKFISDIDKQQYREFNVQYKFNKKLSVKGLWEGRGEDENAAKQEREENKNSFGGDVRFRIDFD